MGFYFQLHKYNGTFTQISTYQTSQMHLIIHDIDHPYYSTPFFNQYIKDMKKCGRFNKKKHSLVDEHTLTDLYTFLLIYFYQ